MLDHADDRLIDSLMRPETYPHPVDGVSLRETHISWVLLTGEWAYKIKKPVDLGFVDFTTLERRQVFCNEELRLNRRLAGDLYQDVVPILRTPAGLRFGHAGESGDVVEFAVQMQQFDEDFLASRMLSAGQLTSAFIDELAIVVSRFHASADRICDDPAVSLVNVLSPVADNFRVLQPLLDEPQRSRQLEALRTWSLEQGDELHATLVRRAEQGFVRDCHGDLHLGNIVRWRDRMMPFDCIEFDPALRRIDVMNEIAFLVMDLQDRNRPDLAWRFLNRYLEETGDYAGLAVLPFYLVYRAIVRAKVDALRLHQSGLPPTEQQQLESEWHGYLDLAERFTQQPAGLITITYGVSGSGKTTGTQSLIEEKGWVRIRSDIERKRLFANGCLQDREDLYSPAVTQKTYACLAELARQITQAGFPVVVDATFLKCDQRTRFRQLADELNVPFQILEFEEDEQTLCERVRRRQQEGSDASDATPDVVERQLQTREPLAPEERPFVISPA